jgi:hypothetical protein
MPDMTDRIAAAIKNTKVRAFLGTQTADGAITLHVTRRVPRATVETLSRHLGTQIRITVHALRRFERLRSLQALTRIVSGTEILFDPTCIFERAKALVELSVRMRSVFGAQLVGLHFEPRRRSVFAVLSVAAVAGQGALEKALTEARSVVDAWRKAVRLDFDIVLFVGDGVPPGARLVAIDNLSIGSNVDVLLRSALRWVAAIATGAVLGAGYRAAAAADSYAVSQPNLSIMASGGRQTQGFVDIGAKANLPVFDFAGAQMSVLLGSDGYVGAEGKVFVRNPDIGSLGLKSSFETLDDIYMVRTAAEAELYLGVVTLGADVGQETGADFENAFSQVEVKLYATPDLLLKLEAEFLPDLTVGRIGAEWRPAAEAFPGLSVFADGEFGDDERQSVMLGLKYHFGDQSRTLLDRDRQDTTDTDYAGRNRLISMQPSGYIPLG